VLETKRLSTAFAAIAALTVGVSACGAAEQVQSLQNFEQVSDSLCRGAQPSADGLRELAKMGVNTIVDLRGEGGRATKEAQVARSLGMEYVNIPLDGFQAPTADQVAKVQAIFENPSSGKVFVHCRRGADRTGTMVAIYRIEHDHWKNQQALDEAKSMKMAGAERLMQNFVMHYTPAMVVAGATKATAAN
jgi:tyrosine-protein phosphatase SIW14